jgi:hypothetical protein
MKTNEKYLKHLRSNIVITIKTRYPDADYRQLLKDWGYDVRLSRITDPLLLLEIHATATGAIATGVHPFNPYSLGTLDAQGKYAFALMHKAGWTVPRLRALLIKTAGTAQWKFLSRPQQRQILSILKNYIQNSKSPNPQNDTTSQPQPDSTGARRSANPKTSNPQNDTTIKEIS